MTKVLVADDSLTIQKVVGITLSTTDYEISRALNESELIDLSKSEQFDLILLDFGLSESKSGYDLAKLVKANGKTKVLMMLGTFDTIDDAKAKESDVDDAIVKPFESSLFIRKCQSLIEGTQEGVDGFSNEATNEEIGSDWTIDSPEISDNSKSYDSVELNPINDQLEAEASDNELENELSGWGMEIPGVIGKKDLKKEVIFPEALELEASEEESTLTPKNEDLEYPTIESDGPKLTSAEVLTAPLDEEDEELDITDPAISPAELTEKSNILESEIEAELETDDLWAADDSFLIDDKKEEAIIEMETEAPVETISLDQKESSSFDEERMIKKITESIVPIMEEMIKKYASKSLEKVAWEVIPDLAENLIKEEIRNISNSVQENSSH